MNYDTALPGMSYAKPMKPADASLLIQDGKGNRYDPAVVDIYLNESGETRTATDVRTTLTTYYLPRT